VIEESQKEKEITLDSPTEFAEGGQSTRPEENKAAASPRIPESAAYHQEKMEVVKETNHAGDNSDEEIFLPNIVDCAPDHDDS
jgi:hypothetical protein